MKTIWQVKMFKALIGLIVLVLFCGLYFAFSHILASELPKQDQRQQEEEFRQKLEYYLDLKSQSFLGWLVAKEKQLVEMIQLTSNEVKTRAEKGDDVSPLNFESIYSMTDELVTSYDEEIIKLIDIYEKLDSLEYAVSDSDIVLWEDVAKIKDDLVNAIEDRKLYADRWYTNQDLVDLIQEYSVELDTLIQIYENLEKLGKNPTVISDEQLQAEISRQEQQVLSAVSQWGPPPAIEEHLLADYEAEADSLVKILLVLDSLEVSEEAADPEVRQSLRRTKGDIINSVDEQLLDLAGYNGTYSIFGPTVTEYLDAWRKARMADLEVRFAEYEIVRQHLIDNAEEDDLERMLAQELSNALLNYANDDYLVSEMQLDAVIKAYSDKGFSLDPVIFYKGETLYARGFLDAATENYKDVLENYPDSQYLTETILRMMQISRLYGQTNSFYSYYDMMQQWVERANPQELNQAHLLAGHTLLADMRYQDALQALTQVTGSSSIYWESQYLLGIINVNLDNYDAAITIFERIAGLGSMPWSDMEVAQLRNGALLKLGLIAYQRGELTRATEYFAQVSGGYGERDKSVIATAWAALKKGEYQASLDTVTLLLRDYLTSNYTYEALVLAAHCKRIMGETEGALQDYRFVAAARSVFDVSEKYEEERQRLIAQAEQLRRLEEMALDQRDQVLYPEIVQLRETVDRSLENIRYRSDKGEFVIQDFTDESREIVDQIATLDVLIEEAKEMQRDDLAVEAENERSRLLKILMSIESKNQVLNSSYLLDHPIVSREAESRYRQQTFESVVRDLETEKARIQADLVAIQEIKSETLGFGSKFELEVIGQDFQALQNDVSQFRAWIALQPAEEFNTDLVRWSDRSGFEIADITYTDLQEKQDEMDNLAGKIVAIEDLWEERKQQVENRMRALDTQMEELQANIEAQQISMEKIERERYFRSSYFDTTTSETVIRPLIRTQPPDSIKIKEQKN